MQIGSTKTTVDRDIAAGNIMKTSRRSDYSETRCRRLWFSLSVSETGAFGEDERHRRFAVRVAVTYVVLSICIVGNVINDRRNY